MCSTTSFQCSDLALPNPVPFLRKVFPFLSLHLSSSSVLLSQPLSLKLPAEFNILSQSTMKESINYKKHTMCRAALQQTTRTLFYFLGYLRVYDAFFPPQNKAVNLYGECKTNPALQILSEQQETNHPTTRSSMLCKQSANLIKLALKSDYLRTRIYHQHL